MNFLSKYILPIAFVGITTSAFAQKTMSLDDCRTQALEYNKDLKEASMTIQEAESGMRLAKTAYLPMFDASISAMFYPNLGIDVEIPGGFLPTAESLEQAQNGDFSGESNVYSPGMEFSADDILLSMAGVTVTQPIYTGGKIRALNKQAELGHKISLENYTLTQSEVIQKVDQAFWNLVTTREAVVLAQSYVTMLTELEEQMNDMYEIGLTPASEKLKVSVQKNQAELELLRANNGQKLATTYLNQIIGQELTVEIEPSSTLSETVQKINTSNGIAIGLSNRSELKMLQNKIDIAKQEEIVVKAGYRPQIGIQAGYSYNYGEDLSGNNGALIEQALSNISGQASIPVFHWGEKKHKKKLSKLITDKAVNELSNVGDLITLEITQTQLQAEETYQTIQISKKGVAQAQESLEETKASFEAGLNTTTDLLNSQAEYQRAQYNLLTSLMNYENMKTIWNKVTGQLTSK